LSEKNQSIATKFAKVFADESRTPAKGVACYKKKLHQYQELKRKQTN
jgi:hypothetical protein